MSFAKPSHIGIQKLRRSSRNSSRSESSIREVSEQNVSRLPDTSFTPYRNKNLSLSQFQLSTTSSRTSRQAIKKLKGLIDTTWNVSSVSPIFNFQYKEVNLKRYARCLKDHITCQSGNTSVMFEVSYATSHSLRLNESDHDAVELTVHKIPENKSRTLAYQGIFLSWGSSESIKLSGSTFLPVLLWKGSISLSRKIHTEFQNIHDCIISPKCFEDEDIRCLVVGYFASNSDLNGEKLDLKYFFPTHKKTGRINISLSCETLSLVWKCIHPSDVLKWTLEEVNAMWESIHHHLKCTFGIDFDRFQLEKANLPYLRLSNKEMQVRRIEEMNLILSFMMRQCNTLESVAPTLHWQRQQ